MVGKIIAVQSYNKSTLQQNHPTVQGFGTAETGLVSGN
jgi:hypothetical protein